MRSGTVGSVLAFSCALLAFSAGASALPSEVVIESTTTRLTLDLGSSQALIKSITNIGTGEIVTFDPSSADFVLTTDKGQLKRTDFKVTDVISGDNATYVVMDGQSLNVTQRYQVFDSGCIKRSLQVFPKTPILVEKVSLINLKLNEKPPRTLHHNARFLSYDKGGVLLTVEMPAPSRDITLNKDGILHTEYEPVRQVKPEESWQTVPAVFQAWRGDMLAGFEAHRDYSYELSGWRKHATVRTSSESRTALTTAYDGYKAVDDDPTTRWRTEVSQSCSHWLEIEFPESVKFNTMTMELDNLDCRPTLEAPSPFEQYRLQAWTDGGWKDIAGGSEAPTSPVRFAETQARKVRLLVERCRGRFSLWDFRLYRDYGSSYIIPENLCSRFWIDKDVRMPFTYFNTWYISHPGIGRMQRARGLLTYQTVLPQISLAAQCGMENFVLDSGWKYMWSGVGLNPDWPVEFPEGERPFVEAADSAGINLAAWFFIFWLEGDNYDHQWRVVNEKGGYARQMCLLSGYYDFVKNEMLHQIRNSHMKVMKIDGFVAPDTCYATNHNHKPGRISDAIYLAFMQLAEELKKQYPDFRLGIYTWDPFWVKYSEIVHTYQDHGGLTTGELAPTRAKMNWMHDREMFNEAYWRYLVRNQIEGSAIIQTKTPDWREEVIGNLAGPTRRQISTDLGAFTAEERNWIRDCMNWSRKNARFLEQFKPFFPNPQVSEPWGLERNRGMEKHFGVDVLESNTLEGYAHIFQDEGYIFIFNPTFHGAEYTIPVSRELGFTPDAKGLKFQIIYPYFEDILSGAKREYAYGESAKGYLPAEKHVVIRVCKQPIPALLPNCRYTVSETIWDSVNLTVRAVPTASGGTVKTKLVPPKDTVIDELTLNGKPVKPGEDGSYEITLHAPVRGDVNVKLRNPQVKGGKKTLTADVSVSGDLLQPNLMLFLLRGPVGGKDRLPKAEPGELAYVLRVNGKQIEGVFGETLEKDWETNKEAGWWVFSPPTNQRKFTVTVECSEKVRPVLLYSAIQDSKETVVVGKYSRTVPSAKLTNADPETFFHGAFPEEREYFPVIDLAEK